MKSVLLVVFCLIACAGWKGAEASHRPLTGSQKSLGSTQPSTNDGNMSLEDEIEDYDDEEPQGGVQEVQQAGQLPAQNVPADIEHYVNYYYAEILPNQQQQAGIHVFSYYFPPSLSLSPTYPTPL